MFCSLLNNLFLCSWTASRVFYLQHYHRIRLWALSLCRACGMMPNNHVLEPWTPRMFVVSEMPSPSGLPPPASPPPFYGINLTTLILIGRPPPHQRGVRSEEARELLGGNGVAGVEGGDTYHGRTRGFCRQQSGAF